jgi:hypothetical protein
MQAPPMKPRIRQIWCVRPRTDRTTQARQFGKINAIRHPTPLPKHVCASECPSDCGPCTVILTPPQQVTVPLHAAIEPRSLLLSLSRSGDDGCDARREVRSDDTLKKLRLSPIGACANRRELQFHCS